MTELLVQAEKRKTKPPITRINGGFMENSILLRTEKLNKSFDDLHILKDIDLTITQGEKVFVIGPSGSGKSTLLRCLNCLEDPTSGAIYFNDVNIADTKVNINIHRQQIGMVFQQFNLFNNKTVKGNIMLAPTHIKLQALKKQKSAAFRAKIHNFFSKNKKDIPVISLSKQQIVAEEEEKAMKLLKRIGLEDKANAYPSTLSGGQKQRIAISRSLAVQFIVKGFDVK